MRGLFNRRLQVNRATSLSQATPSHLISILLSAAFLCALCNPVSAEIEVDLDTGLWIPFLPDYTAGSIVSGGVAQQRDLFRDDQTDVGIEAGLSGFFRHSPDSHRVDFDFGLAGIDSMGSTGTFADPGATQSVWFASLDGNGFINTNDGNNATFALDSDVFHNRQYIGLGDTWLIMGDPHREIDMALGFSHLGFEQDFVLDARFDSGRSGQYVEALDSDYLGGEIRSSMIRRVKQRDLLFEFGVGLFNMNARYQGQSTLRTAGNVLFDTDSAVDEIDEFAVTVDAGLRLDTQVAGVGVRPGITFKYISDMPVINHPMTEVPNSDPVFLSTKNGYFLGLNVEIFLYDNCCRRR